MKYLYQFLEGSKCKDGIQINRILFEVLQNVFQKYLECHHKILPEFVIVSEWNF